jgi:NhaP-type Na+/H+ and K+/H+ antiporter
MTKMSQDDNYVSSLHVDYAYQVCMGVFVGVCIGLYASDIAHMHIYIHGVGWKPAWIVQSSLFIYSGVHEYNGEGVLQPFSISLTRIV